MLGRDFRSIMSELSAECGINVSLGAVGSIVQQFQRTGQVAASP